MAVAAGRAPLGPLIAGRSSFNQGGVRVRRHPACLSANLRENASAFGFERSRVQEERVARYWFWGF
ncbi:unnamed protein product, partial [marine sediment metagenome]